MKELSRRSFLGGVGLTTAAVVLGACAPKPSVEPTQAPAPSGATAAPKAPATKTKVAIQTSWFAQPEPGRDFWQRAIKMFEEKPENADITIELINVETTPQDVMAAIAGGTSPCLYHMYGGTTGTFNVLEFAPKGVAVQLDEFIATSKYIKMDEYLPGQWDNVTWNNKIWGLPVTEGGPGGPAMTWHKRYFAEAGLDPDKGPKTWDDCIDIAKKLTKYAPDGSIDIEGYDPLDSMGQGLGFWAGAFESMFISDDKKTMLFDQGNWVLALETISAIYHALGPAKMQAHKDAWPYWTGPKSGFPNGKRAMICNGYWQPGELRDSMADKSWKIGYDYAPTLSGKKFALAPGGHTLWMTKWCKTRNEAWRFMDYIMSEEIAIMEFKLRGGFIYTKSLASKLDITGYDGLDFFLKLPETVDVMYPPSKFTSPIGAETTQLWRRAIEEVNYDKKQPKQALLDINAELQKSLDRANEATKTS